MTAAKKQRQQQSDAPTPSLSDEQLRDVHTFDDAINKARTATPYGYVIGDTAHVPDSDVNPDRAVVAKDVANAITTFWVPPNDAHVVLLTGCIITTWLQDAFDIAMYARIKGDTNSGKSVVEQIIQYLAYPGRTPDDKLAPLARRYVIATSATMFHTIERYNQPTMILSEAGKWLGETSSKFDKYEDVKALVQEGSQRNSIVPRMVNGELKDYETFCPKVLSGTGTLARELENRCIPIISESVDRARHHVRKFRQRDATQLLLPVRDSIERFASIPDYLDELRELEYGYYDEPETPRIPDLGNRDDDVCIPLLAWADSVGDEWGYNMRLAMTETMAHTDDTPDIPLDVRFLQQFQHAMRQGYVAATSRAKGRQTPPLHGKTVGTLTDADFGQPISGKFRKPFIDFSLEIAPDKREAHIYVERSKQRDNWSILFDYVSRANNGSVADSDTVLSALRKADRLTQDTTGRNLTVKLSVWKGTPQVRCLRIDISDMFAWDESE